MATSVRAMDGRGLSCDRVVIVVVAGVIMADRVIFARRIIIDVRYGDSRGSIRDGSTPNRDRPYAGHETRTLLVASYDRRALACSRATLAVPAAPVLDRY